MKNDKNIITDYPFYQKHKPILEKLISKYEYNAITVLLTGNKHQIYKCAMECNKSRHIAHFVNRYHRNKLIKYINIPTEEQFYNELKGKNYNIKIGTTLKYKI